MIEVKELSRHFGDIKAVDSISFEIFPGEIVGFLGPNGAGKTTTMRMMVGYLQPSGGQILIDGKDINEDPLQTAMLLGYLPEHNPLYDEMIVYDYLVYVSTLRKMSLSAFEARLPFVIEKCGLAAVMGQNIGTLSKGYRQRVGLAQAIIHDPKILILDEPTSGLDPNQILEIRQLILELGKEKTLILSSHIMQEVQALCSRVIIINQGKIVADDNKENLSQAYADKVRLVVETESAAEVDLDELLELNPDISLIENKAETKSRKLIFAASAETDLRREIAKYMNSRNVLVLQMYLQQHSLEDVFHQLTAKPSAPVMPVETEDNPETDTLSETLNEER